MRDIAEDANDLAITETITLLAKQLNLEVIAEGVENNEQLLILRKLGCDLIQGFLFSRPIAADKLSSMLALQQEPRIVRRG